MEYDIRFVVEDDLLKVVDVVDAQADEYKNVK